MDPQTRLQFWTFYPQPVPPPSCCKDFAFYFAISQGLSFNLKSTVTAIYPMYMYTAKTQYRKFETNISRQEIARTQSQFPHSCVFERFVYSHDQFAYSAVGEYVVRSWEYIHRSQTHERGNWD
jgi:hypothetical protein